MGPPYDHPMAGPALLLLVLVLILGASIPTRRLSLAGVGPGWLVAYLALVVVLGLLVASGSGPAKLIVPVLVIAVAIPFAASPETVGRVLRRVPPGDGPPGASPDPGRHTSWSSRAPWRRDAPRHEPKVVGSGPGRTVRPDDPPLDDGRPPLS